MPEKILYIFIDESGDLTFTKKSSKHFYMWALVIDDIHADILKSLYDIRHKHLSSDVVYKSKQEKDLEYFHATEDLQIVRDEIFNLIESRSTNELRFYSTYSQKNKANPVFHKKIELYYNKHVVWLINSILYTENMSQYSKIMIFFDGMPVSRNKKAMFKGLKEEISTFFSKKNISIPYFIYSHQSKSHSYLQLADYISWAINVSKERSEHRPYNMIHKFIKNIWNPFEKSTTLYY